MGNELKVALIQSSVVWEHPEDNRSIFERKINSIKNVDIVILPEMFTSGFTMTPANMDTSESEKNLLWMKRLSIEKDIAIIGSMSCLDKGEYFNRLYFVAGEDRVWQYDKRHTFTLAGEDKVYKRGTEKLIVAYKGFKFCPMICYDLRFPVWARNIEGYDVLLYVANWPAPRIAAWDTLLKARAIENMAYCIGVNRIGSDEIGHQYPGHSAVYDCLGEQLAFSNLETIVYATLSKDHITKTRQKLNFLEDRDQFSLEVQ